VKRGFLLPFPKALLPGSPWHSVWPARLVLLMPSSPGVGCNGKLGKASHKLKKLRIFKSRYIFPNAFLFSAPVPGVRQRVFLEGPLARL